MKAFENACYLLAMLGIILTWLGRRVMIMEAASFSLGWAWAIRLLPLADIMFLARFWESARGGAMLCIGGLICFMPLGGKIVWEQQQAAKVDYQAEGARLPADRKTHIFESIRDEHLARVRARQHKLAQLNAHMTAWYTSMTERRAKLTNATEYELTQVNDEAAAYQSLREVTKQEAAELQTMLDRKLDGVHDVSDEEYGRYLHDGKARLLGAVNARELTRRLRHEAGHGDAP